MTASASAGAQRSPSTAETARFVQPIPYIGYNRFHSEQSISDIKNALAAHTLVEPVLQSFIRHPYPCSTAALTLYGKVGRS
jgi:hypothetical protein